LFLLQSTKAQLYEYITTIYLYIILYAVTCFDISVIIREFYICALLSHKYMNLCNLHTHTHIQGVTGGTDQTSGGCSLCWTIPI